MKHKDSYQPLKALGAIFTPLNLEGACLGRAAKLSQICRGSARFLDWNKRFYSRDRCRTWRMRIPARVEGFSPALTSRSEHRSNPADAGLPARRSDGGRPSAEAVPGATSTCADQIVDFVHYGSAHSACRSQTFGEHPNRLPIVICGAASRAKM